VGVGREEYLRAVAHHAEANSETLLAVNEHPGLLPQEQVYVIATLTASLGVGADVDQWTFSPVSVPLDAWDQKASI
jgi:hypothetical protein